MTKGSVLGNCPQTWIEYLIQSQSGTTNLQLSYFVFVRNKAPGSFGSVGKYGRKISNKDDSEDIGV